MDIRAPIVVLLVVIIYLLHRQQSRQDFYVVEHLGYDLVFKEHVSAAFTRVTAERGPLIGGCSESFSDFGAAKAAFDRFEGMSWGSLNVESVNHIYVVTGSRPFLMFPTDDKPRGTPIHTTPYSDLSARRKEACEEHRLGIENDRYAAELRQHLSAGGSISDAPPPPSHEGPLLTR
jgi:hypothetical protein